MKIPVDVQYFKGNSDNFQALYDEVDVWLKKEGITKYELHSTPRFHMEEQRWHILITLFYPRRSASPILDPSLMGGRRVD